jgi:putative nucleotidyltransferase with HDIG domain
MDAKALVEHVEGLYTLPEVYRQLQEMLGAEAVNEAELAELISYDPVFSARVFQLAAESPTDVQVNSISEAVSLLGSTALQQRLHSTSTQAVFSRVPSDIVDLHDFWHHSVCCAMAAEALARRCNYLFPEALFLSGLMHDIGQLVIYQHRPELAVEVLRQAGEQESFRYRMEQQILPWTHAELGGELLRHWSLPEVVCRATEFHHEPHLAGEFELQASLVHMATAVANCIEPSWKAEGATRDALRQISPRAWNATGLSKDVIDDTVSEISIQSLEVLRIVDPGSATIF